MKKIYGVFFLLLALLVLLTFTEKRRGKSDGYPFAAGMGKQANSAARGCGSCG